MFNRPALWDGRRYTVSVQGSANHYSIPRRFLDNWEHYEALEVAIIPKCDHCGPRWERPGQLSFELKDIDSRWEPANMRAPVGAGVPVEDVRRILQWMQEND